MALFVVIVAAILVALSPALAPAFEANLPLNSIIAAILLIGIFYIFRQVWMLNPEVAWIENFRKNDRAGAVGRPAAADVADGEHAGANARASACRCRPSRCARCWTVSRPGSTNSARPRAI